MGTSERGDPVVDFGEPIEVDATTGEATQYGTIHSGNNGAHIVPTNPTQLIQMTSKTEIPDSLRVIFQRLLLGEVTPDMRLIAVRIEEKALTSACP